MRRLNIRSDKWQSSSLAFTSLIIILLASPASGSPSFRDLGRYAAQGINDSGGALPPPFSLFEAAPAPDGSRTAGLAVGTPTSTSIRFTGYAEHQATFSGTTSSGAFVLDTPTAVTLVGAVRVLETGGSPSSFDFRIVRDPLRNEFVSILNATGTYDFAETIQLDPGDFQFFIGAVGTDAIDGIEFDLLLTIPEPNSTILFGLGLVGLATSRNGRIQTAGVLGFRTAARRSQ